MDSYQKYDIASKVVTLGISAILLIYGVHSYKQTSDRELKKPFVTAQIEACREITKLVAETSRIESIDGRFKFKDQLWNLYYSQGMLFLGNEALGEFRNFIFAVEDCKNKKEVNECHHANLGAFQFNIAQACRNQLVTTWGSDPKLWIKKLDDPLL